MTYYLAPSLVKLRAQIDARWPGRDKSSDGWIGDTSHQARPSDHNPDYSDGGVVRAIDIDVTDIDVNEVLKAILVDSRVSYVIYNSRIWGGSYWRPYTGINAHKKHIHVSLEHTDAAEKNTAWALAAKKSVVKTVAALVKTGVKTAVSKAKKAWPAAPLPLTGAHTDASHKAWVTLLKAVGYKDKSMTTNMQRWLKRLGYYDGIIEADHGRKPVFGPMLVKALQSFLRSKGLYKYAIDGDRGTRTIKAEIAYLNLPANRGK